MFGDLDWPLNASRGLSASAELLVNSVVADNELICCVWLCCCTKRLSFVLSLAASSVNTTKTKVSSLRLYNHIRLKRKAVSIVCQKWKVKVRTLDIEHLRESTPQKHLGTARVLEGSHSFTCTPTRSSAIGMSHTCLCLPRYMILAEKPRR